ncbi:MAG: GIN domain-containing protein [Candidatus Komeilibacteria bacterium]
MKKIYLISLITIVVGLIFYTVPHWFSFLLGFQLLLLPMLAGVLMVLVQNEDRSYRFLPKLIIGSLITSFVYLILLQVIEYDHDGYFVFWSFLDPALFLTGVSIFGGLIGIVIRGTALLLNIKSESKFILVFKKIFGGLFLSIGSIGTSIAIVFFLVVAFYPSSSWLNTVMVDFRVIDVIGFFNYYLLLLSVLFILATQFIFVTNLGLILLFPLKRYLNKKLLSRLIIYFFIFLAVFLLLASYLNSKFELKKEEMKGIKIEEHFDIKDFDSIYVSRYVEYDEIKILQGDKFDIVVKGSQYDRIGLDFKKTDNTTLSIKRSELETYYNTKTWTMENENALFPAGTKHLIIEITMPDIEKIEIEGGNIELANIEVDNIEIKLNKRFNDIKGNIKVEDTLKLDAKGGVINLSGSAKNLIINSGDCWIEMDKFMVQNATINAVNTSRLNVNVSNNMEIETSKNSGIINHNNSEIWDSVLQELAFKLKSGISGINISFPKDSSLWWNDEDGYSILVPGNESIEVVRDDGMRSDNFAESSFVAELLDITKQVLYTRGFVLNESNSSTNEIDKRFYDYVRAYKNDDELCVVKVNPDYGSYGCTDNIYMCNTVEITCGNDLAGSQVQQRPFLEALELQNKETIVQIMKQIGDFYKVAISYRRTGSAGVVKKEDSGLRLLYTSQEEPYCQIVETERIPSNVLEGFEINGCWTEDGYRKFTEN